MLMSRFQGVPSVNRPCLKQRRTQAHCSCFLQVIHEASKALALTEQPGQAEKTGAGGEKLIEGRYLQTLISTSSTSPTSSTPSASPITGPSFQRPPQSLFCVRQTYYAFSSPVELYNPPTQQEIRLEEPLVQFGIYVLY